jgi:integrase
MVEVSRNAFSIERIHDLRGTQARTRRQSLLHRDLSGLDGEIKPYGPRHQFCSWLEMAGKTTIEIEEAAGHKTMRQAAQYAHLSPKEKQFVVGRIPSHSSNRRLQNVAGVTTPKRAPVLKRQGGAGNDKTR